MYTLKGREGIFQNFENLNKFQNLKEENGMCVFFVFVKYTYEHISVKKMEN